MPRLNSAGFRVSTRVCPGCNTLQAFPDRQATCSLDCGYRFRTLQRQAEKSATSIPPQPIPHQPQQPAKPTEQHAVDGDLWNVALAATRIKTLDELIEHCQIDTRIWEVERFIANKWEMGAVLGDRSTVTVEPLFQIKASFRRKKAVAFALQELEDLKTEAKRCTVTPMRPVKRAPAPDGNIAEITIPDVHFGKLAWGRETGHQDYDMQIAVEGYNRAVSTLLGRISGFRLDCIVFVIGNDVMQCDSRANTTTAGTQVDTDSRYHKVFKLVRQLMVDKIMEFRQIAPVRVIVVPGNHDGQSAWHLGDSLECYFHNCTDVVIDNEPTARKYLQHGKVMLMWTHGDVSKKERDSLPLQMATEQPQMFGATAFREAHTGHLHTTRVDEYKGVRVRILPSLCPPDYWHSKNQYTSNIRSAEVFVWNRAEGLISTASYCIDDSVARAA